MAELFVVGAHKTGTSTMVSILNSCADTFIAYEFFLNANKRAAFCKKFPKAKEVFENGNAINTVKNLENFTKEYRQYDYVGDKFPGIHFDILNAVSPYKNIFTIRDVRTWPAKNSIISMFTNEDAVKYIIDYTKFLIHSFESNNCLRVSMEEMISNNTYVLDRLMGFLNIKLSYNWWKLVSKWDDKLKVAHQWWGGHRSATIKPNKLDTITTLKQHEFWDKLLPIFDKYYGNLDKIITLEEVQKDLQDVENIKKIGKLSLNDLFDKIQPVKIV